MEKKRIVFYLVDFTHNLNELYLSNIYRKFSGKCSDYRMIVLHTAMPGITLEYIFLGMPCRSGQEWAGVQVCVKAKA